MDVKAKHSMQNNINYKSFVARPVEWIECVHLSEAQYWCEKCQKKKNMNFVLNGEKNYNSWHFNDFFLFFRNKILPSIARLALRGWVDTIVNIVGSFNSGAILCVQNAVWLHVEKHENIWLLSLSMDDVDDDGTLNPTQQIFHFFMPSVPFTSTVNS